MAKDSDVPQPGPARLAKGAGPDEWLEQAKQCKYLPEADMKRLCEIVKECLMEGTICQLPALYQSSRAFPALHKFAIASPITCAQNLKYQV
jgi:hypothetical protein